MAEWEEIRRLAADFQRAQFADSAQLINVDLVHVESRAIEVSKQDRGTHLILGQLIDKYLDQLAEEVNDKLQEVGQVNTAELCKTYDLPGDFLTQELCGRVGRIIDGQVDEFNRGVIFTQAFICRQTARIRGVFSALTPTPVSALISVFGFHENLLYVLEELVNSGRLKGTVVGGRQDKAVYIPEIYSRTQNAWVDSFLKQNGYLFEALTRLGIPDPVSYIKKRLKSSKLLFLRSACVGPEIIAQLEASVEEAISSQTWVDLQVVSEKFISSCMTLFDDMMQQKAQKQEVKNNPVFLVTEEDLKVSAMLESSSSSKKDKREDRRKKASGSGSLRSGGGGNAREIRIRKTKKKNRRDGDSDDEPDTTQRSKQSEVPFLPVEKILEVLEVKVTDCPEETLEQLAEQLLPLTLKYQEVIHTAFLSSSSSGSSGTRKQNVKDVQEEINNLYNNIRLFEKGTKLFSDTQQLMMKHILRTVCTDLTNILLNFMAADLMMATENPSSITAEVRMKILGKLSDETKAPLMKLHNSLNGKTVEDFLSSLEAAAEDCGLMLKKTDKKKEQALLLHKQALLEQLNVAEDPALILHLTSVLLFQNLMHCMLHAPGRCVPNIIGTLQPKLSEDQYKLLVQYQGLVVKRLVQSHSQEKKADGAEQGGEDSSAELESVLKELNSLSGTIKELVLNPRKPSTTE
uniref:E3 UFM1-protein ligase 1 n=1 Tax=Astyanax mexicanus TaxID=7994 RepID=A0A3B1K2F5_ASTMX